MKLLWNSRYGSIGDPRLTTVDDVPAIYFLSSGLHTSGIRAVVGFSQALYEHEEWKNRDGALTLTNAPMSSPFAVIWSREQKNIRCEERRTQTRKVLLLLSIGPKFVDWVHNERRLHRGC